MAKAKKATTKPKPANKKTVKLKAGKPKTAKAKPTKPKLGFVGLAINNYVLIIAKIY